MANNPNVIIDLSDVSTTGFTITPLAIFHDKELTPEAKGVYSQICSVDADKWELSVAGLCVTCNCGREKMMRIFNELKAHGYLSMTQERQGGKFGRYVYTVHKDPKGLIPPKSGLPTPAEPTPAEPTPAEPTTANPTEYNNNSNKSSTNKSSTNKGIEDSGESDPPTKSDSRAIRHKYGAYRHVLLTDKQYENLISEFGEALISASIDAVDEYCEKNGKGYKNYELVIQDWGVEAGRRRLRSTRGSNGNGTSNPFAEMLAELAEGRL